MKASAPARLFIASTGAANLASVRAMCVRAGVDPVITELPDEIYAAERALLPGVGAFGAAMRKLESSGMGDAFRARIREGKPVMGICLGMQLMFAESEETQGVQGLGIINDRISRFACELPLPQLGWNRIDPGTASWFVRPGWAYFANSYRLAHPIAGMDAATAVYGESFVACLASRRNDAEVVPNLLLCQFHPELSGAWGLDLFSRWMETGKEEGR